MKSAILLMFSGNLNSTGSLHQLLNHEDFKSFEIVVHHIGIGNREGRIRVESEAVNSILDYYRKSLSKEFLYTHSIYDTTGFSPFKSDRYPYNLDICAFMGANVCLTKANVTQVAFGGTSSVITRAGNFADRMTRTQSIFASVLMHENIEVPEFIFPVKSFASKDIWEFLPPEVRQKIWYCNNPILIEDQKPIPCGKCNPCLEMQKIIGS